MLDFQRFPLNFSGVVSAITLLPVVLQVLCMQERVICACLLGLTERQWEHQQR
jgi:hypothetical protein